MAPTKTRTRGPASPTTSSARRTCTRRWATAAPIDLLGFDRATIDEAANATTIILHRTRSERRAAGAVPASARRGPEEAQPDHRVRPEAQRPVRARVEDDRVPGGRRRRGCRRLQRRSRHRPRSSPRATSSSSPVGPTWPSIPPKSATASSPHLSWRPDAKVLPAFRRGNVVGAHRDGPRAGRRTACVCSTSPTRLPPARSNASCCSVAIPLADFPDTDLARRMMAGARRIIAIDTFLTKSSSPADVVLAAAAYGEKSGTTTNIEGRVTTLAARSRRRAPAVPTG